MKQTLMKINDNDLNLGQNKKIVDNQECWICPKCKQAVPSSEIICPYCGFKFEENKQQFEDIEMNKNKNLKPLNS